MNPGVAETHVGVSGGVGGGSWGYGGGAAEAESGRVGVSGCGCGSASLIPEDVNCQVVFGAQGLGRLQGDGRRGFTLAA